MMLIVVGLIIVGIAVAIGINMFEANEIEANRSALIQDLQSLASKAQQFYMKPSYLSGGNRDFRNATMRNISGTVENDDGNFYIESTAADNIVFVGVGTLMEDDDTIRVRMKVFAQSNQIMN